jgi:hypothetical protein
MSVPTTDAYGTTTWSDGDGRAHRDGDLPAKVYSNGSQWWYKHGQLHRDGDLPAIKNATGSQVWYQYGKLHRSFDLPAVVYASGCQMWFVNHIRQTPEDRAQTRRVMAEQGRRWSPLRAAFVGACAASVVMRNA